MIRKLQQTYDYEAHNLKVAGSNPAPATKNKTRYQTLARRPKGRRSRFQNPWKHRGSNGDAMIGVAEVQHKMLCADFGNRMQKSSLPLSPHS